MKKRRFLFTAGLLFTIVFLNGCLKDSVTKTYTYTMQRPMYQTKPALHAQIQSGAPEPIRQPGKLVIKDQYIFLNEVDKGIHVIDNSNPAQPKNIAFITIPGNVDLAVKGNMLYADLYTNLLTLNITDPTSIHLETIIPDIFPSRYSGNVAVNGNQVVVDSALVITEWIVKDTTVTEKYNAATWERLNRGGVIVFENCPNCDFAAMAAMPGAKASPIGVGGSLARFSIVGERLYTVGNHEGLKIINISNEAAPAVVSEVYVGLAIETVFPLKDNLFIGAANGLYIYNIANPDQPRQVSVFTHAQSCDPVIADGNNAYVTLRSGTVCDGTINQLDVLDITNLAQPALLKSYTMTHPLGLSKDGTLLFICDGTDGLKLYDASNPENLQLLKTIAGLETYDVIAYNGLAIVVAKDGLYQFDYSNRNNIRQLSKITLAD